MNFKFKIEYAKFLISAGYPENYVDYLTENTAGCSSLEGNSGKWYIAINLKAIKRYCKIFDKNFEDIVMKTISHETMHIWLTENISKDSSDRWDNISEGLQDYGIF